MSDRAFAVSTVLMMVWVTLWMLAYLPIWQTIPLVKAMFPLTLSSGTVTYSDTVTSIGIIGTLILGSFIGYFVVKSGKEQVRHWH